MRLLDPIGGDPAILKLLTKRKLISAELSWNGERKERYTRTPEFAEWVVWGINVWTKR